MGCLHRAYYLPSMTGIATAIYENVGGKSSATERSANLAHANLQLAVVELNGSLGHDVPIDEVPGGPLRRRAIAVARDRAFQLRSDEVIGDDACRVLVQELGWAELSAGGGRTD